MSEHPDPLMDWVTQAARALGVDPAAVDVPLLLDVARDAAHGIARPAAPLTTFLVGVAAGRQGGTAQDTAAAARIVADLLDDGQSAISDSPA